MQRRYRPKKDCRGNMNVVDRIAELQKEIDTVIFENPENDDLHQAHFCKYYYPYSPKDTYVIPVCRIGVHDRPVCLVYKGSARPSLRDVAELTQLVDRLDDAREKLTYYEIFEEIHALTCLLAIQEKETPKSPHIEPVVSQRITLLEYAWKSLKPSRPVP